MNGFQQFIFPEKNAKFCHNDKWILLKRIAFPVGNHRIFFRNRKGAEESGSRPTRWFTKTRLKTWWSKSIKSRTRPAKCRRASTRSEKFYLEKNLIYPEENGSKFSNFSVPRDHRPPLANARRLHQPSGLHQRQTHHETNTGTSEKGRSENWILSVIFAGTFRRVGGRCESAAWVVLQIGIHLPLSVQCRDKVWTCLERKKMKNLGISSKNKAECI